MTTTNRQKRRLTNASAFVFPIQVSAQTLEAVQNIGHGKPYKFAVIRADGTLWTGRADRKPDVGLWQQRAAAVRHAKRTTGLIYDAVKDRVEAVGRREVGKI